VFLPFLLLLLSPILIPTVIGIKLTTFIAISILKYTPLLDVVLKVVNFMIYDWNYWPKKHIWSCFYSLKARILPEFVTADNQGFSLLTENRRSYTTKALNEG